MDYNEGFKNGYKTAKAYSKRQRIRDYENILKELRAKREELAAEYSGAIFRKLLLYRMVHVMDAEKIIENHIKELKNAE